MYTLRFENNNEWKIDALDLRVHQVNKKSFLFLLFNKYLLLQVVFF